jgi:hypothetical protein
MMFYQLEKAHGGECGVMRLLCSELFIQDDIYRTLNQSGTGDYII